MENEMIERRGARFLVEHLDALPGDPQFAVYDTLPECRGGERIRLGECADASHTSAIVDAWLGKPGRAVLHLYL